MNDDQTRVMADAALRRMDHVEWLRQFAVALETSPRERNIPMTPFRAGAISRLRIAVEYILLLQAEARDKEREIAVLKDEIETLKPQEGR